MMTFFAVTMPVLILLCGFSIDLGLLELKEQKMQNAADAAAISGELEAERGTNNWITLAQQDAGQNGFTNGVNGTMVSVGQYGTYGAYSGRFDVIQVTISQPVKTIFMGALNGGYVTAKASAVAQITPCVFLTGTTLQTYTFDGYSGDFKSASCPFNFNGNIETTYTSLAPEAINISGSAGGSSVGGYAYPPPNYNAPAVTDPLSYITSPTFNGTCNHTSYAPYNVSTALTLSPGNYCKGLNITNCSNVTLSPGLYVITGGGTWYNSTITGTGVTLYFTSGGGGTDSKFNISGNSVVTLSAPTTSSGGGTSSSSIAGILIFTDRNWTHTNPQDVDLIQSTFTGDGIWYLPSTGLYVNNSGVMTGTNYFGIVADNMTITGTSVRPLNNYSYVTTGNPMRTQSPMVQ